MDLLKSIFKGDKVIWIIFLMLCLISIVEVFSASSTLVYKSGDHWGPITKHCVFLMVGTAVVVLFHNIPYKWFQLFPVLLLPASAVMLVAVMFMGRINNAARWIEIAGITFQPSEFAKMAIIIVTAFILSKGQTDKGANPKAFKHIMLITGFICLLIFPENFSTAALLFGVVYLMMFIGRVAISKLALLGGGLVGVAVAAVVFLEVTKGMDVEFLHRFDTWRARIEKFVNNKEVPAAKFDIDRDGQVGHARIAVATSNVLGKGPGNSVQRDFLSQAYSDFIFAIVIEELGLVGGGFVVFLYILLLVRAGKIAKKCDRTFPAFLVLGIGLLLVTQALFNMMVAVGLAPVTGQPLPLVSRGGTSTIINCVYIGMLLSVSRYTAKLEEQKLHDAMIPMTVETGVPDTPVFESQAQTAVEPTAQSLNNDEEFN
ncbi:MAG: FtsW/RodA/SpoVE family cell cycle protein [Bacteroides sp.]|nr:FtsW/RodA/SpoVE family cell cycle protein [Bacteroides sp.]